MSDDPRASLIALTPMNPAYQYDPHSVLRPLRERCPVAHDHQAGTFIVTGYAEAHRVLANRRTYRDGAKAEAAAVLIRRQAAQLPPGVPRAEAVSILVLDDPDHARIRRPLQRAFYARVKICRPRVERVIDAALDAIDPAQPFDLMARYCVPIPVHAIAAILGVDGDNLDDFREWSEGVILGLNPFRSPEQTAVLERSRAALQVYFRAQIAERRANPSDDLISDMVALQAEGAEINDAELAINLIALLVGGNLTTTDLIGNGARQLMLNPTERDKLLAQPSLAPALVEEVLRYEGPIDITQRIMADYGEIGGCRVAATQAVTAVLRAANRDPAIYDDAEAFIIDAKRAPHLSFGGGSHICIGAPLARLEGQLALLKLFQRFPGLRMVDAEAKPRWRTLPFFRGLEELLVQA
ncbi:cytochrome P450 [Sphingomonas oligophenolica]|uniref:Cytochrome P450 n=1 Tax=Sphingomonas oligophenolica TaxID=301154 RepID=A0A502BY59_9SPHN|nr:cytochrome P450 [Sphingomonas oligophenolica]TPG05847.1 cytochrome P450 [Sphingomonas oligophenolica]